MSPSAPEPTLASAVPAPGSATNRGESELGFREIYERWFAVVWRSLRRLGVPPDRMDDAFQDVFVVVHRQLAGFEGRASFGSWLFGIVLRVVADHKRSRRRRARVGGGNPTSVDPDTVAADAASSPAERAELAEQVRRLYAILGELDDKKRTLLVLAELEQMTAPEIAELLGIPLNTVYSRLRAARQAFDRALAERCALESKRKT